jgi:hypothetical protein
MVKRAQTVSKAPYWRERNSDILVTKCPIMISRKAVQCLNVYVSVRLGLITLTIVNFFPKKSY